MAHDGVDASLDCTFCAATERLVTACRTFRVAKSRFALNLELAVEKHSVRNISGSTGQPLLHFASSAPFLDLATSGAPGSKAVSFHPRGCPRDLIDSCRSEISLAHVTSQRSATIDFIGNNHWPAGCRVWLAKPETCPDAVTLTVRVLPRMQWQPWNDGWSG